MIKGTRGGSSEMFTSPHGYHNSLASLRKRKSPPIVQFEPVPTLGCMSDSYESVNIPEKGFRKGFTGALITGTYPINPKESAPIGTVSSIIPKVNSQDKLFTAPTKLVSFKSDKLEYKSWEDPDYPTKPRMIYWIPELFMGNEKEVLRRDLSLAKFKLESLCESEIASSTPSEADRIKKEVDNLEILIMQFELAILGPQPVGKVYYASERSKRNSMLFCEFTFDQMPLSFLRFAGLAKVRPLLGPKPRKSSKIDIGITFNYI